MQGRGQHEHADPRRLRYTLAGAPQPAHGALTDPLDEVERRLVAYAAKATEYAERDRERHDWFRARQAAFMDAIAVVQSVRRARDAVERESEDAPPGTVF